MKTANFVISGMTLLLMAACGSPANDPIDPSIESGGDVYVTSPEPVCDRPQLFEKSPSDSLAGSGWHRVYVQGGSATADKNGQFAMNEHRNEIAPNDHFLLSAGALVEWIYPLEDGVTGRVFLHIARVDEAGVTSRYELFLVHNGEPLRMVNVDSSDRGETGYVPFERCFHEQGVFDISPEAGDHLLLRATNLTGGDLGIVINPPDYFTWIDIEVQ